MKATMDETGCITIKAETPLESFALRKWCEVAMRKVERFNDTKPEYSYISTQHLLVDTSSET